MHKSIVECICFLWNTNLLVCSSGVFVDFDPICLQVKPFAIICFSVFQRGSWKSTQEIDKRVNKALNNAFLHLLYFSLNYPLLHTFEQISVSLAICIQI